MKTTKSFKALGLNSMKSLASIKSTRSQADLHEEISLNFEDMLVSTCNKFCCPPVYIRKDYQRDHHQWSRKQEVVTKYKKITLTHPASSSTLQTKTTDDKTSLVTDKQEVEIDMLAIQVTAVYDNMHRLAEIAVCGRFMIPREFMQVLALIVPYFEKLHKISIEKCKVDVYTIHELQKMLPLTSVTEIHFRDLFLAEGNYATLLENGSTLQSLSLSRCWINDEVCKQIAAKLHYSEPAEKHLRTLDFSSNRITDLGAKYLGEALRSNRHLRYLNLADNHITDDGASYILDILAQFPLTSNEIMDTRRRYTKYLLAKMELYLKYLNDTLEDNNSLMTRKSLNRFNKKEKSCSNIKNIKEKDKDISSQGGDVDVLLKKKAELITEEVIGPFKDPFSTSNTTIIHNVKYSTGNMALCYLNLSYNNLSYISVKKIHSVLLYQAGKKNLHLPGLIKIVIEGNYLPDETCPEFISINKLKSKQLSRIASKTSNEPSSNKRKSRTIITTGNAI